MEVCISNYGMKPDEPGPCLRGNIELVNDDSQFEIESEYSSSPTTVLNMILLNQLTLAELTRLAKNNHTLRVKICCNIFDEAITPKSAVARIDTLTQQELVILSHLAAGKKYREIALLINISIQTVKSHAYSAYRKIGLHSKLLVGRAFIMFRVFKLLQCGRRGDCER